MDTKITHWRVEWVVGVKKKIAVQSSPDRLIKKSKVVYGTHLTPVERQTNHRYQYEIREDSDP